MLIKAWHAQAVTVHNTDDKHTGENAPADQLASVVASMTIGADAAAALPAPTGAAPAVAAAALAIVPAAPTKLTGRLACCCCGCCGVLLSAPVIKCRCQVAVTGSRRSSQEGQYLVSSFRVRTCRTQSAQYAGLL